MANVRDVVIKLQSLPEQHKRIIFFGVLVIAGAIASLFAITSTKNDLMKIQTSINAFNVPSVDISLPDTTVPNTYQDQTTSQSTPQNSSIVHTTYTNEVYGFQVSYPTDWTIDQIHTTDLDVHFLKETTNDNAAINVELVSQTKKITSAEHAIDKIVARMKQIVTPKHTILIGNDVGYEAVGTLCTSSCNDSSASVYSLLSVIYFSHHSQVFYLDYAEGTPGAGYKTDIHTWNYYNEFRDILSSFTFTN